MIIFNYSSSSILKRKINRKLNSLGWPSNGTTTAIKHIIFLIGLEETLFWYNGGSDEKSQNLMALKLEVLGPLLFSYDVLSSEVCYNGFPQVRCVTAVPSSEACYNVPSSATMPPQMRYVIGSMLLESVLTNFLSSLQNKK